MAAGIIPFLRLVASMGREMYHEVGVLIHLVEEAFCNRFVSLI